jgi:uncharacterized protein YoxC
VPVAGIVTIVLALAICVALAYYLLRVVLVLNAVNDTLGKVTFGVNAIAHRTEPLGELLTPVATDLDEVASALEAVVASVSASTADTAA